MKRFYPTDLEKLVKEKANEIYSQVCVELIEKNGAKEQAKKISLEVIKLNIRDEKDKDPLFSLVNTCLDIKTQIEKI